MPSDHHLEGEARDPLNSPRASTVHSSTHPSLPVRILATLATPFHDSSATPCRAQLVCTFACGAAHIPPFTCITNNARVGPGDAGCALCGACRHEARAVVTGMTKLKAPTLHRPLKCCQVGCYCITYQAMKLCYQEDSVLCLTYIDFLRNQLSAKPATNNIHFLVKQYSLLGVFNRF